jgi:hypothetical protein
MVLIMSIKDNASIIKITHLPVVSFWQHLQYHHTTVVQHVGDTNDVSLGHYTEVRVGSKMN